MAYGVILASEPFSNTRFTRIDLLVECSGSFCYFCVKHVRPCACVHINAYPLFRTRSYALLYLVVPDGEWLFNGHDAQNTGRNPEGSFTPYSLFPLWCIFVNNTAYGTADVILNPVIEQELWSSGNVAVCTTARAKTLGLF